MKRFCIYTIAALISFMCQSQVQLGTYKSFNNFGWHELKATAYINDSNIQYVEFECPLAPVNENGNIKIVGDSVCAFFDSCNQALIEFDLWKKHSQRVFGKKKSVCQVKFPIVRYSWEDFTGLNETEDKFKIIFIHLAEGDDIIALFNDEVEGFSDLFSLYFLGRDDFANFIQVISPQNIKSIVGVNLLK